MKLGDLVHENYLNNGNERLGIVVDIRTTDYPLRYTILWFNGSLQLKGKRENHSSSDIREFNIKVISKNA